MARLYHQKLRPLFYKKDSSTYGGPRRKERGSPFFLTMFGASLSGRDVSNRVKSMAKRLHPGMKGDLVGTRYRKFVVLSHPEAADAAVSSDSLAKQMTHSRETADSHYYVDRGFPEQVKVAEYLKTIQRPPTCTITRPPASAVETATTSDSSRGIDIVPPSPVAGSNEQSPAPTAVHQHRDVVGRPWSDHISVPQKKELLHLFAKQLSDGVCPDTAMVSSTIESLRCSKTSTLRPPNLIWRPGSPRPPPSQRRQSWRSTRPGWLRDGHYYQGRLKLGCECLRSLSQPPWKRRPHT